MSAVGRQRQIVGRVPSQLANRWNRDDAQRLCSAFGAVAIWDTFESSSITLNGTDAAAQGDVSVRWPRPADANDYALSQGTAANQPLVTGAPAYGQSWPSVQYTAANLDVLGRATTNIVGTLDISLVSTQRLRSSANGYFFGNAAAGGGVSLGVTGATQREFLDVGIGAPGSHNDGAPGIAAPEVWIGTEKFGQIPKLRINGALVTLANIGTRADPGASAMLLIGSLLVGVVASDVDHLLSAVFLFELPDTVAIRISHALGAGAGVAA